MTLQIEINGSADESARYISFTPSPCRIRQTQGSSDIQVTLRSRPEQAGGGQAVFYSSPGTKSRATLPLTLPGSGQWVDFWMGGKWGNPSVDDRDCLLLAGGSGGIRIPLMVRVRK